MTPADQERVERGVALAKVIGDVIDQYIEAHPGELTVGDILAALSLAAAAVAAVPQSATVPRGGRQ